MSIFKQATKERLRFETRKGELSVEQLWDLSLTNLATIVRNLKKQLTKDNDDELSFLDETATPVDRTLELKFNVVKAIYLDKKEEREAEKNAAAKKAQREKLLGLIADKQDEELKGKSVAELTAELEALDA